MGLWVNFVVSPTVDVDIESMWARAGLPNVNLAVVTDLDHIDRPDVVILVCDPNAPWPFLQDCAVRARSSDLSITAVVCPQATLPEGLSPAGYLELFGASGNHWAPPLLLINFNEASKGSPTAMEQLSTLARVSGLIDNQVTDIYEVYREFSLDSVDDDVYRNLRRSADYWQGPALKVWLTSTSSLVGGARPIDLIVEKDDRIAELFVAMDQGVYV